MAFEDKTLVCRDCGANFVWTQGEQEFFASRGLQNIPVRCHPCRAAKKAAYGALTPARPGATAVQDRPMYPAVCAECGSNTMVPFQPRLDRPIYCSVCYARRRMMA